MVRRLRIALPITALVLVGLFFVNAGRDDGGDVALDDLAVTASADDLRMESPHFTGLDAKGNPFDITADAAIQTPGANNRVALERPRAVTKGADTRSVVTAENGEFQSDNKILLLKERVTFEHQIGNETYVLVTPAATVAIDDETVVSEAGVEGAGPDGAALTADRMRADNNRGTVFFEGNVRMRLFPASRALKPTSRDGAVNDEPVDRDADRNGDSQAPDRTDKGQDQ